MSKLVYFLLRHAETLVWKAARASGAAPSFFRPEGIYVDGNKITADFGQINFTYFLIAGGIVSNNPSMDLLTEIAEYNVAQRATGNDSEVVEPTVLLSLGTGVPPVKKVNKLLENVNKQLNLLFVLDDSGRHISSGQCF